LHLDLPLRFKSPIKLNDREREERPFAIRFSEMAKPSLRLWRMIGEMARHCIRPAIGLPMA